MQVTLRLLNSHRERGSGVPPEQALAVARGAKEAHGYVCHGDLAKEAARWGGHCSFGQVDCSHVL